MLANARLGLPITQVSSQEISKGPSPDRMAALASHVIGQGRWALLPCSKTLPHLRALLYAASFLPMPPVHGCWVIGEGYI